MTGAIDPVLHNRAAWDRQVDQDNEWTRPVGPDVIARARAGEWSIVLIGYTPTPREWFPAALAGVDVLCLASGGGQQGPVLAAAGAAVTVFDNSPAQLARDREVADRDGLALDTVEGDMRDLSCFPAGRFDLVLHPCSTSFVPDVRPVWRECAAVLGPGGVLIAGLTIPVLYVFDDAAATDRSELIVRHPVPYSDLTSLTDDERWRYTDRDEPLCFGHTLEDQVGGQLD